MRTPLLLVTTLCASLQIFGQAASFGDPASSYNRLLIENKGENAFYQIGTYKVKGSPYFFGEKNTATVYAGKQTARNIPASYNMYNQSIDFYEGIAKLTKECAEVDSFRLEGNSKVGLEQAAVFLNGRLLGAKKCAFYQVLSEGPRFKLYKLYTAEIGSLQGAYVGSEMRQFDIRTDYFYIDSTNKKLKKLRTNAVALTNEFKGFPAVREELANGDIEQQKESTLKHIFTALNEEAVKQ